MEDMSASPETDMALAGWKRCDLTPSQICTELEMHARKLERQRNALAEALRDARGFVLLHSKGIAVQEGGLLAQIDAALSSLAP